MEKKDIQIALEPIQLSLNTAVISFDQELFSIIAVSGNQGRNYTLSPKHAKRLLLLLQKQIEDYESKFGLLETELLKAVEGQTTENKIGFGV